MHDGTTLVSDGLCSWLENLKNKAWEDSDQGSVTFTQAEMSGWSFQHEDGTITNQWDCYYLLDYTDYIILIPRYSCLFKYKLMHMTYVLSRKTYLGHIQTR